VKITRREFCEGSAALVLAGAVFNVLPLPAFTGEARAQSVTAAELMQPNPLGEMSMGADNAPVTIVEYASMTCPHCAHFATTTLPALKKDYIDTGKVRYIFREFPLDKLALAGSMIARCVAKDDKTKYFAMIDTLFRQQETWAFVQKPVPPLKAIARQAGLTEKDFEACLANQQMEKTIFDVRQRAAEKLGVTSTPTIFVNGEKQTGDLSIETLVKLMQPYLKAG
jgi:protein-disulfide isomerase